MKIDSAIAISRFKRCNCENFKFSRIYIYIFSKNSLFLKINYFYFEFFRNREL